MNYSRHGLSLRLFGMFPSLLALHNSTENTSIILKSVSRPFMNSIKREYTNPVTGIWKEDCQRLFNDIHKAIISNPCLLWFDHWRLIVLYTNFSAKGFSCAVCQPDTDANSEATMNAYCLGLDFSFMTKEPSAALQPVAFGGCKCRGNEVHLHSHLGEGYQATGPSTRIGTCSLDNNLFGLRIVAPSGS
jgi:hypothetical protein